MDQHNRVIRNKLSSYLKGKRVVIVGPAPSVVGSEQAALIDSYDVVVRLNKALPIPKDLQKDVGTRTDILYNCMNPSDDCGGIISIPLITKCGVKFVVGAYPPIDHVGVTKLRIKTDNLSFYHKHKNAWKNFCYTDKTHFLSLWKLMKLPNTGTMAILDLLRFDIKELYITGISFFKGGYIRTYRDYDENGIMKHLKKFNLHNPEKQLDYACTKLLKDGRVKMDNTLTDILTKHANTTDLSHIQEGIDGNGGNGSGGDESERDGSGEEPIGCEEPIDREDLDSIDLAISNSSEGLNDNLKIAAENGCRTKHNALCVPPLIRSDGLSDLEVETDEKKESGNKDSNISTPKQSFSDDFDDKLIREIKRKKISIFKNK